MNEYRYIYGPVPSRRLGISLGISPIPKKTCNYSCIYCQLGRTDHLTNLRQLFYPVGEIIDELKDFLKAAIPFDVITIVGEGEPTLYLGLGELIHQIRKLTTKPLAVITNGALLYDPTLQEELASADIILPTLDAWDEASFKKINRPHGALNYSRVINGIQSFSKEYQGQIWIEIMLMEGISDDEQALIQYKAMLKKLKFDKLYINTPIRPPAEANVKPVEHKRINQIAGYLGGISIDLLESEGFHSEIKDDYEAILSIIKRHPMNQFEIEGFLKARGLYNGDEILNRLKKDKALEVIHYKGYNSYRLK